MLPKSTNTVIIGGGILGTSIAYYLTKQGVKDVVLCERKRLSCGSSWHAAGILAATRTSESMIKFCKETLTLMAQLSKEIDNDIGYKNVGSLWVTNTQDRVDNFKHILSYVKSYGVSGEFISKSEAQSMWPILNLDDVLGAVFIPEDSLVDPQKATEALAKVSQKNGAMVFENCEVERIITNGRKVSHVVTSQGEIAAENVVIATGIWTRDLVAKYGVNVPLQPTEHYYVVTDEIEGCSPDMPLLRDFDLRLYARSAYDMRWRKNRSNLIIGFFEHNSIPWGNDGIPPDFEFGRLEQRWGHLKNVIDGAKQRMPVLHKTKLLEIVNGPESFTFDNSYFLGKAPNYTNLFVATGMNSRGIQSCGGMAKVTADWIITGQQPNWCDIHDVDLRRSPKFTANRKFLNDRSKEILGLLYDITYPFLQLDSARPIRKSPFHDRLADSGACFGETGGWERANWYAPRGVPAKYKYSYSKQNWYTYMADEHDAVRNNVAVFDQTSFAKFIIQGKDAYKLLDKITPTNLNKPIGKVIYTQLLNEFGGIESDVTITRIGEQEYFMVSTAISQQQDFDYVQNKIIEYDMNAIITDVTSGYAVLGIMGPKSREVMKLMSNAEFSNESFPFATSQIIDFGYAKVRATRITFVGELGWELYIPTEFAIAAYDTLMNVAKPLGIKLAGYHVMNALRLEKGFIHWGHDVSNVDTPIEANLGFVVHLKSKSDFLGRQVLEQQKILGVNRRLVLFKMDDPESLLYHHEAVYRNGKLAGHVLSGMYSNLLNKTIAYVNLHNHENIIDDDYITNGEYEILFMNEKRKATPSLKPFYDPQNLKIKV